MTIIFTGFLQATLLQCEMILYEGNLNRYLMELKADKNEKPWIYIQSVCSCGDGRITVQSKRVVCVESFDFKRFSGFRCKSQGVISASGKGFEEPGNGAKIVLRLQN